MIPGIVLAAGKSTRMGQTKALLPFDGDDTLLTRVIRTLREGGADTVVAVIGHDAFHVHHDLVVRGAEAEIVFNADYEIGQLTSMLAGIETVDDPDVEAVLFTLVDVPLLRPSTVRAVIDRYRETRAPVVRPVHGGRFGHPLLIDRSLFDELRTADPAAGAKPVVHAHATPEGAVEVDDPGAVLDVDTREEYEALRRQVF